MSRQEFVEMSDVLNDLLGLHRRLLKLSRVKRTALVEGDLKQLEGLLREQKALMEDVAELEDKRTECKERIARLLDVPAGELTLRKLADLSPEPFSSVFADTYANLQSVIDELTHLNEGNTVLIESSLVYIDFSLRCILGDGAQGNLYGNHGQAILRGSDRLNILDRRA